MPAAHGLASDLSMQISRKALALCSNSILGLATVALKKPWLAPKRLIQYTLNFNWNKALGHFGVLFP